MTRLPVLHRGARHASWRRLLVPHGPYDGEVVPPTLPPTSKTSAEPGRPDLSGPRQGDLLGGRYRLERMLVPADATGTPTDGGVLWRAEDLVLSRPVAVRLVWDAPLATRAAFLEAAATTAQSTTAFVAATYDAAEELFTPRRTSEQEQDTGPSTEPSARPLCYLVREWVEGSSLRDLLVEGPMQPEVATTLFLHAANALTQLHVQGHTHGRVHPGNLIVRADGQVRVCDAGVGLALAITPTEPPSTPRSRFDAQCADDVRGLGQSLYAALTARWPGDAWRGLPTATRAGVTTEDLVLPPRRIRAGVPRPLDAVVCSILGLEPLAGPSLSRAAQVADALEALPILAAPDADAPELLRPYHPRRRRAAIVGLVVALLALAVALGISLGHSSGRPTAVPAFAALPSPPGAAPRVRFPIHAVTSFDPPPGDGSEYPDEVGLAYDGKQDTAWHTQVYASREFGHLKHGVGLIVDLGQVRNVREVDLTFPTPGTDIELRAMAPAAAVVGTRLTQFPLVAAQSNVGQSVALRSNVSARYWLIWLTGLPPYENGFRGGIAEMAFRS